MPFSRWYTLETEHDDDGNLHNVYFHHLDGQEEVLVVNYPLDPDDPLYQAFYAPIGALLDRIAADDPELEVEG